MPSYLHIEEYRAKLQELIEFGGSDNEENIRPAFQNCLDSYCRDHRERLVLIPELRTSPSNKPDGTVKDSLRMARGYWEAKDSHDDLDAEIQAKFNRGYPRDNIIFEDSQTAVLVQNASVAMRVDMSRDGELHRLIRVFLRLPLYQEFYQWAEMGQKLLDLHIGFESAEPYPLERHDREGIDPKRAILRADKSRGTITLDERTTLAGIPERAWEYRLGSRSALEWVLDQYKERKPRDPTIREKFNTYRFSDHKERVIDLLRKVCTVSVATMEIVDGMTHLERLDLLAEVAHPLA